MIKQLLDDKIVVIDQVSTWEEAITKAATPLLKDNFIEARYIDAMIDNVNRNGSYFVLVPGIAMPHAEIGSGAVKNGIAILKLKEDVLFPDNKYVNTLIVLSSVDGDSHMEIFSSLAELLIEDDFRRAIIAAQTKEEIISLI